MFVWFWLLVLVIMLTNLHKFAYVSWKYETLKEQLVKFSKIAQNGKGFLTVDEFAKYLELPVTDQLKELFNLYDRVSFNLICVSFKKMKVVVVWWLNLWLRASSKF